MVLVKITAKTPSGISPYELRMLESMMSSLEKELSLEEDIYIEVLNGVYVITLRGKSISDPVLKSRIVERVFENIEMGRVDFDIISKLQIF